MVGLTLGALVLGGCQSADGRALPDASASPSPAPDGTDTPTADGELTYVAMGDSYTAAPLFPLVSGEQIDDCLRSQENYPSLVAQRLGIGVTDVSCSGASTVSIFSEQSFTSGARPPQLDALSDEVDLVTLGIGANDFRFFSKMMFTCLKLAERDPEGAPCRDRNRTDAGRDRLERKLGEIRKRVTRVVRAIGNQAPSARILLIGYPQLLPDEGTCTAKLPLALGDYDYVRGLNLDLAAAVAQGGVKAGAEYVDLVAASQGHDICSEQPWVAGIRGDPRRAMGLHPYPAEQRAVADLVVGLVEGA